MKKFLDDSLTLQSTWKSISTSSKTLPISTIIITYKSNKHLYDCLLNIINSQKIPKEIIIIDNNSPLSPFHVIKEVVEHKKNVDIPNINFYKSKANIGFAKAVNMGINLSKHENILLVNPDLFLEKSAIKKILNSKRKCSIIGGKTYMQNGELYPTVTQNINLFKIFIEFTSLKKILNLIKFKQSFFWDFEALKSKSVIRVSGVSGCFMLFDKQVIQKIDHFDENYFLYLEDLDFCLKAYKNNIPILFEPNAYGIHVGGGSSLDKPNKINEKAWQKSKKYFCKKNFIYTGNLLNFIIKIDTLFIKIKHNLVNII